MHLATEHENLLAALTAMLREEERPALRRRIENAMEEHVAREGGDALRFLRDLDIFARMPGAEFMYSRGIAETLRVGEDIFELAYAMKRAMP